MIIEWDNEKPQNMRDRQYMCRFVYNSNELVGRATDIFATASVKSHLTAPKGNSANQIRYVMKFFESMCNKINLFKFLLETQHELTLYGNAGIFCVDQDDTDTKPIAETWDKDPTYKGWENLIIIPLDQVRIRKVPLSDDIAVEYVPDPQTKEFIFSSNDNLITDEFKNSVKESGVIKLDTDPYSGSHFKLLTRAKHQYEPMASSIIERFIKETNEKGEINPEVIENLLCSFGLTKEIILGCEDINISKNSECIFLRNELKRFVENNLFKPVAKRKGFFDVDEFGNEILLYPELTFIDDVHYQNYN